MPPLELLPARGRTIVVLSITGLLLAGIALRAVHDFRETVREAIDVFGRRQTALAQAIAAGLQAELEARAASVRQLNALPSVQHVDGHYLASRLRETFSFDSKGMVTEIQRVGLDARVYVWEPGLDGLREVRRDDGDRLAWARDPANRARIRASVISEHRGGLPSQLLLMTPTYETAVSPSYPPPTGALRGLLGLQLSFAPLAARYLDTAASGAGGTAVTVLADEGRTVLYRRAAGPGGKEWTLTPALWRDFVDARVGTRTLRTGSGLRVVSWAAFVVGDLPILIRCDVPYSVAAASVRRAFSRQLTPFAMLSAVLCLLAWTVVRHDQSEARYRDLLEQAGDGICILNRSGRVVEANRAASEMLALSPRVTGPPAFGDLLDERQRPEWVGGLAALGSGQRTEREWSLHRGDGRTLQVDVSLARVGRNRVLAIVRDISDRRALEEQLRQSQKMEAVGRLAGGIAHDFNNLLTAILGYTELVLEGLADDDARRADAIEIRRSAERAAELTRQLLAFSRRQVLQPRILDLNRLVADTSGMLKRLIGEQIRYELRTTPGLWLVEADPHQVEQVLVNLVLNAREAMPNGGTLTIETANVQVGAANELPGLEPGQYAMLAVHDTGHGIDDTIRPHLFEPFFTTRPVGRGTGLGLSTAQGIVRQSGGDILVESKPGAGSSFRVHLPRTRKVADVEAPAVGPEPLRADGGMETVLLVEDDAAVRTLLRDGLARRGYHVLDVGHPAEALRIAATHVGVLHALISDVVMPHTSGPALARQLLELRPTLRVLFVSGYPSDLLDLDGRHSPFTAFLPKPFSAETVAAKLRELLDLRLPR